MKTMPGRLKELDENYSNLDHVEPEGIEQKLKAGGVCCEHAAWEHYGMIWFEDDRFHEKVMRYGSHVATVSGKTFKQVIEAVNEQFGSE